MRTVQRWRHWTELRIRFIRDLLIQLYNTTAAIVHHMVQRRSSDRQECQRIILSSRLYLPRLQCFLS